jgi:hypothetical protein
MCVFFTQSFLNVRFRFNKEHYYLLSGMFYDRFCRDV